MEASTGNEERTIKAGGGWKLWSLAGANAVASIVTVISFFTVRLLPDSTHNTVYMVVQGLFLFGLVCLAVWLTVLRERSLAEAKQKERDNLSLENRLQRVSAFAGGYRDLHQMFHDARDLLVVLSDEETDIADRARQADTLFYRFLQRAVDNLQLIFGRVADPKCRVAIKQMREDGDGQPAVETLCRDSRTAERFRDDLALIRENSDFHWLVEKVSGFDRYFFVDDLTTMSGYRNSHSDWREHYVSTIVWPIRAERPNAPGSLGVVGVLCVDSAKKGVFDRENSVQIGACVADIMYVVLAAVDKTKQEFASHGDNNER